jgi:hypothetical protein
MRKPARTRNDHHIDNPKSKDLGFEDALYQLFVSICYQ